MKRVMTLCLLLVTFSSVAFAQRFTDKLDRGVVAVPASGGSGYLVSWRIFGEEYYGVTYNLYANGSRIATNLKVSNYTHSGGNASTRYQVAAVVNGQEQQLSNAATPWTSGYYQFPVANVVDRSGKDVTDSYIINDISLGDVDGDGVTEFLVKRNTTLGANNPSNTTSYHHYEMYKLDGTRLWWIDMGPNMIAGPDEQWDIVMNDWDEDGKAECILRGADNMIIHFGDGTTMRVGSTADTRWSGMEYTSSGNEYLLYLEGATGKPYNISGNENQPWINYPLPRGNDSDWGTGIVGHRSTKHYFGAPYLDGRHASIFLGRGCYTKHHFKAFDVDPQTHKLTQRWEWSATSGPYFGNGYHNFSIADVDEDGRDEIAFGSMVIDDNGKGLSTTGLGHGDAQHWGDFDPYRKGLEFFGCNESQPNMNYRNATTSKIYYRSVGTSDDGRGLMGNFSNSFPGCMGRSVNTALISSVADREIQDGPATGGSNDGLYWSHLNFRIYWTGDLVEGILDSPGTEREAVVWTTTGGRVFQSNGCKLNNDSKNNPSATGDIIGDWREEIVARTTDNKYGRIYTTPIATSYRIPTLWHDHQYRNAMVWQCIGYNQPPHTSFFLGQLEGITVTPPPYTMTDRTEIANGATIGTEQDGQQTIVCETNDTKVSVADGASPSVAIFNVPSWVQGTNSTKTDGTADIKYEYYTCDVSGGAFTGKTRLVKQGDGVLNLPKVDQTYTGNTDIWAGTVNFDGALKDSPVWLNRFATLNSDGGEFRSIRMDYAATLRPGGENKVGNITVDTLRLGFGSRVVLDLDDAAQTEDQITTKALTIETKLSGVWLTYGPRYLQPVFEFAPDTEDKKMTEGKYLIGNIEKITGNISDIKIEGMNTSQRSYLEYEDGKLYLVVEGLRDSSDIIWNGLASNTWNLASDANFTLVSDETSKENVFVTGDKVYFKDDASQFNVSLNGDMEADTVFVDNATAYTFAGTGRLTGNTVLVKSGTGMLTVSTDNTYTGGNRISGGTVRVSSLSNDTQEYGNLGGVTTAATKFVLENGGTLMNTASVTQGSPMRMEGTEGGCINAGATFNMNKALSGTVLTKKGSGNLILLANNSLQRLVLQAGTVTTRAGQAASTVELQGGTLVDNASCTSHAIIVPEGKTATWRLSSTYYLAYANKITGGGTLTIDPTNTVSRVRITGDWSAFTGTIKHTNTSIWLPLDATTGLPKGTLDIASGCTVTNVVKTFTIGKLTGGGSLAHPVANFRNQDAVSGSNTWAVGNSDEALGDFTFNGTITDGGGNNKANFQKIGSCKMSVAGKWDNTGFVQVNAGELFTRNGSCLGKGALTVARGAVLSGTGSLTSSLTTVNGSVQPGATASINTGALDFGGKNVTVNASGVIVVNARKCAGETISSTNNGCTTLLNIGTMRMNGAVTVNIASSHEFVVGDSIRVWVANSNSGSPKLNTYVIDAEQGLYWDDSRLSEGLLFVTNEVPEAVAVNSIKTSAKIKAQLISLSGTVLKSAETTYDAAEQLISGSDIPAGVYIIRITDGKATVTRKISKR